MSKKLNDIINNLESIFQIRQFQTSDTATDVPNVQDDDYATYRSIPSQSLGEQEEVPPEEEAPPEEMPAEDDMGGMGGMEGMGEEPELTATEIGRSYELKKIYSRLISISSFLSTASDENLLKLKNYVAQSIEMFEVLIANVNVFLDKLDEIIIIFYKFLDVVYVILKKHYETKKEEEKENKS